MPTANFNIKTSDGWVQVADAPKFVRTSAYPHTHPYYVYAGASAPSLVASAGTGTVTFSTGVPTAGQTITVGTEVYTFRASASLPFEVTIGANFAASATNFTTIVNAQSAEVTASNASSVVTLTAKAVGTQGNYGLSTNATNVAVSGATLTGGAEIVQGMLVCHHPFKVNVTMTEKLFARIVNPAPTNARADGSLRLDVFTI